MGRVLEKEDNIANVTLYLYLSRFSGLVAEKAAIDANIGYNTVGYKRMKKQYKEDIKKVNTIDELPTKWLTYFDEAEAEVSRKRDKSKLSF